MFGLGKSVYYKTLKGSQFKPWYAPGPFTPKIAYLGWASYYRKTGRSNCWRV